MEQYKPTSIEENYSNILRLLQFFECRIRGYIWEYNEIVYKYQDINRYNQYLCIGAINPYINSYEEEMQDLAYKIHGFATNVFETLAYAMDCWRIKVDYSQRNRRITDKAYDQALELLVRRNKISGKDKETLLGFRQERNYINHYGRIQFCRFVFEHSNEIYGLICTVAKLLEIMQMDEIIVANFDAQQLNFLKEMENELSKFESIEPLKKSL